MKHLRKSAFWLYIIGCSCAVIWYVYLGVRLGFVYAEADIWASIIAFFVNSFIRFLLLIAFGILILLVISYTAILVRAVISRRSPTGNSYPIAALVITGSSIFLEGTAYILIIPHLIAYSVESGNYFGIIGCLPVLLYLIGIAFVIIASILQITYKDPNPPQLVQYYQTPQGFYTQSPYYEQSPFAGQYQNPYGTPAPHGEPKDKE